MLLEEKLAFKQQNMTFWEDTRSCWHVKGLKPMKCIRFLAADAEQN